MAIITRCRMPPDNWNGYQRSRSSGEGIPTELSREMAASLASARFMRRCRRSDSVIWRPIRTTGLSAVIGSWKIMLSCAPHTWRSWTSGIPVSSWPEKCTDPLRTTSRVGSSPMIDRERTVLPEPDSPTTPRVRPRSTVQRNPVDRPDRTP